MSEPYKDPSGNTEAFQSFVRRESASQPAVAPKRSSTGLIIGVVVGVIVVTAIVWLALS